MPRDASNSNPKAAEIVPFPAQKRVGTIRRTAFKLVSARTQREAEAYWFRHVETMRRQMLRAGVPACQINTEISAYHACIQAEVRRQSALYAIFPEGEPA